RRQGQACTLHSGSMATYKAICAPSDEFCTSTDEADSAYRGEHMARDTYRTCCRHCRGISCTITTLGMLLVWVHAGTAHPSHQEAPRDVETNAIWGVFDRSETPSVDTDSAGQAVASPLQAQETRGIGTATSSAGPTGLQPQSASPVAAPDETRLGVVGGNSSYAAARLRGR